MPAVTYDSLAARPLPPAELQLRRRPARPLQAHRLRLVADAPVRRQPDRRPPGPTARRERGLRAPAPGPARLPVLRAAGLPAPVRKIQTDDSRIQNVVYRNGQVWAAQTVFFPAGGTRPAPPSSGGRSRPTRRSSSAASWTTRPARASSPSPASPSTRTTTCCSATRASRATSTPAPATRSGPRSTRPNTMQSESPLKDGEACYYKDFVRPAGTAGATTARPSWTRPTTRRCGRSRSTRRRPTDLGQPTTTAGAPGGACWTPRPAISIADASGLEGDSGTTSLTFDLTLSLPTSQTVTVDWATADGTATTADDGLRRRAAGPSRSHPGETSDDVHRPGQRRPEVRGGRDASRSPSRTPRTRPSQPDADPRPWARSSNDDPLPADLDRRHPGGRGQHGPAPTPARLPGHAVEPERDHVSVLQRGRRHGDRQRRSTPADFNRATRHRHVQPGRRLADGHRAASSATRSPSPTRLLRGPLGPRRGHAAEEPGRRRDPRRRHDEPGRRGPGGRVGRRRRGSPNPGAQPAAVAQPRLHGNAEAAHPLEHVRRPRHRVRAPGPRVPGRRLGRRGDARSRPGGVRRVADLHGRLANSTGPTATRSGSCIRAPSTRPDSPRAGARSTPPCK